MTAEQTAVESGCRLLDWDSEFFARRIATVDAAAVIGNRMAAVESWCARNGIECAYLLADAGNQPAIAAAESHGFRLVDVRMTLAGSASRAAAPHPESTVRIRPAVSDDVARLKAIARVSHRDSRFYVDGRFDVDRCDALYQTWIEKSCNGWADHVVVADCAGETVGYVTCHVRGSEGQIGLVGVDAAHRGQGSGRAMVAAACEWFDRRGLANVSVVTQGRNTAGVRLYQSIGMTVRSIELWFHRWFTAPGRS